MKRKRSRIVEPKHKHKCKLYISDRRCVFEQDTEFPELND